MNETSDPLVHEVVMRILSGLGGMRLEGIISGSYLCIKRLRVDMVFLN